MISWDYTNWNSNLLPWISWFHTLQKVLTKTDNNHKWGQTSTNHQQTTTNHQQTITNHQQTTTKYQQATTNYQQTTTNYQQTTRNGHPCISNQKADVLLLLPAGGNYKDHHDFEIHRESIRGNCLLLSQDLCEVRKIGSASFGRLSS